MHGEFIAFDLETTGLDAASDEIIEIGIARFRDGELVDQYQSLVKPTKPIPAEITQLTGIDQEDVENQPRLKELLPDVARFVGDRPLVAHNAQFDVSFLGKHLPLDANLAIDTVELASIMLPSAPRYNLGSLSKTMGIELARAHRAFDDALATGQLYWRLWEMVCQLPTGLGGRTHQSQRRADLAYARGLSSGFDDWLTESGHDARARAIRGREANRSSAGYRAGRAQALEPGRC